VIRLPLLMLAMLPTGMHAQDFSYESRGGDTIAITGYSGDGGEVTIPGQIDGMTVIGIGSGAFYDCARLTGVTFPDSLTHIGDSAFKHCTGLASLTIPKSVASIGDQAFYNCHGLTSITVESGNPSYCSVEGALFDKNRTTLIQYPLANSAVSYTIPDGVTGIAANAFFFTISLTDVTIPGSIKKIGDYSFCGAGSLARVTIPDSVTSIGNWAFYGCGLTNIAIPDSVTRIGDGAFVWSGLTGVVIPNSVTSIGESAFDSCTALASVTISNSITSIGSMAFHYCPSLVEITIPDHVTSIGYGAFDSCNTLSRVIIPNSVTSIDEQAFSRCPSLTRVIIPNSVTGIGVAAFQGTGLFGVTIPSGVTSIGSAAFAYCGSLSSVTFMGDAPELGQYAFYSTASGFTVYYYNAALGFSSPNWTDNSGDSYPAVGMATSSPFDSWLLSNGFPHNANPESSPNGDGVPLLVAYAFNLDPSRNQSANVPRPGYSGNLMSLTYYAGKTDVTYAAESSTDLQTWSKSGVILSGPDSNSCRTASVPMTGPCRFLRISVHN
jgi:hypothetical protein